MPGMSIAATAIDDFARGLAARTPAPGGGAAAAVAAALGAAAGAMAARYTTGPRFPAASAQAEGLAKALDAAATAFLAAADEDATAYAAVNAALKAKDAAATASAEARASAVPDGLLAACAAHAAGLRSFLGACNPHLVSDVKVGIHLLAGAGRAAWQTLLVNHPDAVTLAAARSHLETLAQADLAAYGPPTEQA